MEKIISERVVSERIIKNNSIPIIGGLLNKFSNLKSSIGGLCIAPIVIILSFGVIIYSENFHKSSKVVEKLELINASEASSKEGLNKIIGVPQITQENSAPVVGEVLYFRFTKEKYTEVEEKETEKVIVVENGQEIEKTIERTKLVEKWVQEEQREEWSGFKLGNIEIDPEDAKLKFELKKEMFREDVFGDLVEYKDSYSPKVSDVRVTVEYVNTTDEIIVIGDISSGKIDSGEDEFIVSNFSDKELLENLQSEENTLYWILKAVSFFLFFFGVMSILGPIISLADFIPFAGKIAGTVAAGISFILALIFVIAITIFVKFWLLILLCGFFFLVLLMGILIFVVVKKKNSK